MPRPLTGRFRLPVRHRYACHDGLAIGASHQASSVRSVAPCSTATARLDDDGLFRPSLARSTARVHPPGTSWPGRAGHLLPESPWLGYRDAWADLESAWPVPPPDLRRRSAEDGMHALTRLGRHRCWTGTDAGTPDRDPATSHDKGCRTHTPVPADGDAATLGNALDWIPLA